MASVDLLRDGHVATIQLNRPEKLNALTKEMTKQLFEIVYEVNQDDELRVVILTGVGEKSFSVGSDVTLLDEYGTNWHFRNRLEYCDLLRGMKKPLIAMIGGYAVGGGFELALCADLRFAAESAKFGATEIKLGWIGGGGVTQLLTHLIGYGKAMKMILSGEIISAQEANEMGILEALVPDDQLRNYTYEFAHKIASYSPVALQTAKHGCKIALSTPLDVGIMYERDMQTISFYTEDKEEGIQAFKEKRAPKFQGR
ncbi:Enoyl-CoA hydratase/carnithine racemase [Seinonella peptonophila]|uniref:Enoyl-CoA hydratase/carnithine racemase n=1 Tax=Seinonella peptonophila TaxID=112248 RepID=A0A1M4T3S3_9BACL|nr:enoyl-CoA hydratase/isomerase family protein [Seinonella peptonophila]SHE39100.1 Enoyl-CoA hydratase/carnithine racemase [Seinonella peptonophila]